MTTARIYKPAKTAMQSGAAKTKEWVLDYEPEQPREIEPLMGWTSSGDMRQQVRLRFDTRGGGGRLLRAPRHPYQVFEAKAGVAADASPIPTISPSSAATPGPTDQISD